MRIWGKVSAVLTAAVMASSAAAPVYADWFSWEDIFEEWWSEDQPQEETPAKDDDEVIEDDADDVPAEEEADVEEEAEPVSYFDRYDHGKFVFVEASDTSIQVGVKIKGVSAYKLYKFDKKKNKYVLIQKLNEKEIDDLKYYYSGLLKIKDLSPGTSYKFKLVSYNEKGKKLRTEYLTAKTLSKAPHVVMKNDGKKTVITWTTTQKNASGYEVYRKNLEKNSSYIPLFRTDDYDLDRLKSNGYKLSVRKSSSPLGKITVKKGSICEYAVRTFKVVNGKRVYSAFSSPMCTESPEAYLNCRKPVSHNYSSGEELKLVKKYVAQVTTKDMTNAEKMKAIFDLCHSHGNYQNDIYKIDANRPVWQLMVKQEGQCATWAYSLHTMLEYAGIDCRVVRGLRSSGQQHFWCQIKLNGSWYDIDAHLGTYLSKYDGDYMGYVVQDYSG